MQQALGQGLSRENTETPQLITEKPFTAVCPRTGSRVFVGDELLELNEPIEVTCPVCDRSHVWNPSTLTLDEATDPTDGGEPEEPD